MNFLKQANSTFKSAKEMEKNLASVGITKSKFMGKKGEEAPAAPAAAAEVPPHSKYTGFLTILINLTWYSSTIV